MNDSLLGCATGLVRIATTIRSGLESSERTIPAINEQLVDLATLGINDFQLEGPTIYCRPAGGSSLHDDEFIIYQAALVMPGGIGAAIWGSTEYHEHTSRPYGEPVNLAPRVAPYQKCLPLGRAMLIAHAGRMLEKLMQDVRLLGSQSPAPDDPAPSRGGLAAWHFSRLAWRVATPCHFLWPATLLVAGSYP